MSTDCESVVSPSIGPDSLPHSLSLPSTSMRNERHSHSGISYEGRVSLIPPRFEDSLRTAYGLDIPTSSFLHSPPFHSNQGHSRMHEALFSPYLEATLRSSFMPPQSQSTPGENRDYSHNLYHQDARNFEIKQENVDRGYFDVESSQINGTSKTVHIEMDSNSLKVNNDIEMTDRNCPEKSPQISQNVANCDMNSGPSVNLDSPKNYVAIPMEDLSEPDFPVFNRSDGSPVTDQNDSREIDGDPSSLINNFLDTTQDVIHHGENAKSLKCQHCPYSTDSQEEFSSHVGTHFDHKCMKCDYTTQTVEQLMDHLKEEHNLASEEVDFESARVPRINSQGKVKTFKCKQCGYVAITKSDFWDHAKTHIKSDKILACNKCPFVTEYKHHLEYHVRNHMGDKPYRCNKCTYSCVNKSMLNSHMKSHSNIYQYRCKNCSYATKYCHSLKLHLRKYNHQPAMVLNPDGTPNPVPIIDVYGTRRGPKLKKDENGMPILPPQYEIQARLVRAHMERTGTLPAAPTVPIDKYASKSNGSNMNMPIHPPLANTFPFGSVPSYPSFIPHEFIESEPIYKQELQDDDNESKDKSEKLNASKSPEVQDTFKCEICKFATQAKDVLSHHMLLHARDQEEFENRDLPSTAAEKNHFTNDNSPERTSIPSHNFANEILKNAQQGFASHISQNPFQDYLTRALNPLFYPTLIRSQGLVHPAFEFQQQLQRFLYQSTTKESNLPANEQAFGISPIKPQEHSETVLDLSKEHTPPGPIASQHNSTSISPSFLPASPPNSDVSTPPSKNRRKGRAYKFERLAQRLSGSGGEEENSSGESDANKEPEGKKSIGNNIPNLLPLAIPSADDRSAKGINGKWKEDNQCKYCDIAFKDEVMYTMHMGYHGYQNPYRCNMCGYDAKDKVAFFLHIARSSHL